MLSRLRPEVSALFIAILQQVQQSKGSPECMALKDADWLNKTEQELLQQLLSTLPPEQRLKGLSAEEVLERFSTKERLQGLDAETPARSLDPETLARLKQLLH